MLDPMDIMYGLQGDAFSNSMDDALAQRLIYWLWMAPPCSSFSVIRNIEKGGPLRSREKPQGRGPPRRTLGKQTLETHPAVVHACLSEWDLLQR